MTCNPLNALGISEANLNDSQIDCLKKMLKVSGMRKKFKVKMTCVKICLNFMFKFYINSFKFKYKS